MCVPLSQSRTQSATPSNVLFWPARTDPGAALGDEFAPPGMGFSSGRGVVPGEDGVPIVFGGAEMVGETAGKFRCGELMSTLFLCGLLVGFCTAGLDD